MTAAKRRDGKEFLRVISFRVRAKIRGSLGSADDENIAASRPVARAISMLSRRRSFKAAVLVRAASHFPSGPKKAPSTAASPLAHGCSCLHVLRGPSSAAGKARKGEEGRTNVRVQADPSFRHCYHWVGLSKGVERFRQRLPAIDDDRLAGDVPGLL
jgi:hypothetical protein